MKKQTKYKDKNGIPYPSVLLFKSKGVTFLVKGTYKDEQTGAVYNDIVNLDNGKVKERVSNTILNKAMNNG